MKKIIFMYDFLKELGGLERVMFSEANALSRKRSNKVECLFSYVSRKEKKKIVDSFKVSDKIEIGQIGKGNSMIERLMMAFLFPGRIKREEYKSDLMISNSFMCSIMAMKRKMFDKTPYIVVMHHPPNFLYSADIKWANNPARFFAYLIGKLLRAPLKRRDIKAVKNADLAIVSSDYTKERIRKIYGIEPIVIYPAVSSSFKVINSLKARKQLSKFDINGEFILLHGRMIKDKRPDWAVEAFSKIKNKNIKLIISGTIEEEDEIRSLIEKLELKGRVKILGRVSEEELNALYNSARLFIMSAPKEDFGLTPVEAMACGCPAVAWKDGTGPQETVVDGVTGFLCEPYSIDGMASKMDNALEKKWDRKKIAMYASKKFSGKSIEKQFLYAVNKLLMN